MPAEELPRMHSDNAYHVTLADGIVYFGSSVDNKVYALSAETGKVSWTFFTEGPVRFAPTIWKGRVYAGSDDGYVYCLKAKDGELIWKYRPGYSDEKVLGNERMISLWPVRTSVLVDDGIVYFGAGVFPYEGIYICALKANDGTVIWENNTIGNYAHELNFEGISPHGYLIASEDILYVPSGRALPAAFDRKSGEFFYVLDPVRPWPLHRHGGTWALIEENELITSVDRKGIPVKVAYDVETGDLKGDVYVGFLGIDMVVTPDVSYTLTENGIYAIDREEYSIVENRINAAKKEQEKLRGTLSDLRRKQSEVDEVAWKDLNKQIEEITHKISELGKEQERLKDSTCKWQYRRRDLYCLILAGNEIFAGGNGIVVALDSHTGKELWSGKLDGNARSLAVSNRSLFVSTDRGPIYCFSEGKVSTPIEIEPNINPSPYPKDKLTLLYESAAEAIVRETGIKKGYCLVLGCSTGRLAYELAKRTELKIVGIEDDPEKVLEAKKRLDEAGLYGSRVVVEQWKLSSLPDYFANLIVSDEMMITGKIEDSSEEMFRVLRPYGGVAYFGQPKEASKIVKSFESEDLIGWMKSSGGGEPELTRENGIWAKLVRGELEGAGSWTHLYANPQNTACSNDQLVKYPLGVLWFGEPGPQGMVERHARAPSPLAINGRLFIQGEETIMCYDSYNGTLLWKREIPGAVRVKVDVDGGNIAATQDGLYVVAYDKCYRLDPATGETMRIFKIPSSPDGSPHRWGYISCMGNILYGSTAMPLEEVYAALWKAIVDNGRWKSIDEIPPQYRIEYEMYTSSYPIPDERAREAFQRDGTHWKSMAEFPRGSQRSSKGAVTEQMMISDAVFAMDTETGKLLWVHRGNRIANISITIGGEKIFFDESKVTEGQKESALEERKELIKKGIYKESDEESLGVEDMDIRLVVALDATTGRKLWEKPLDLTGCGGDRMGTAYHDGILLFFGHFSNHDNYIPGGRFIKGELRYRRITALSARTGDVLWSKALNYMRRPLIIGDKIIIEPNACDLRTGEIIMRSHPITDIQVPWEFLRPGHSCGITSASPNCLFYRSSSTVFCDLIRDRGLIIFGDYRPGCWLSVIAANGLFLSPEASSGCTCSYPLRCSVVLKHKKSKEPGEWSVFITHGAMTPAKHFAINLGAPGDMKDNKGTLWFGYPRPRNEVRTIQRFIPGYGVKFNLHDKLLQGMGYYCRDFKGVDVEGTDKPWLFTSGSLGFLKCDVPLIDAASGEKPGVYTVRLGVAALSGDRKGQRVFDIKLQGKLVLDNFDILREAGIPKKAVIKEFNGIEVEDVLTIELVPEVENPTIEQAPLINVIEVIRE